ncbi:MAG: hypothetical protein NTY47_03160 [Candidatus Omnitrophica bacterium]|nr:hypothetical protein [Candidatus Omnitrophota bacterium]
MRLCGMFAFIPATVLLTISFFVLLTLRKAESQGLKAFGYVVAAFLWLSSTIILGAGAYTLATGHCPMMKMMQMNKMNCKMPMSMMPQGKMDCMQQAVK